MKKAKVLLIGAVLVIFTLTSVFGAGASEAAGAYTWKPNRPINLIVPWGAGGSTDRSARATAAIIEEALGISVVVVNQAGASGSLGTKATMDAPKDGYTWTAGAVKDLGVYKIQGLLDTTLDDWHIYTNVAMPNVISVNANSPYKTFDDLLAAFKAKPGQITVATAGVNSAGHTAMELLSKHTGITYRHVTYDGGAPAVTATVGGEAEVVPQLSVEQVDMIRAGKLRPLVVLTTEPLEIEGYDGVVPPITNWISDFKVAAQYFAIFVPKAVPKEVSDTLDKIWEENVMTSDSLRTWAKQNAVVFDPAYGKSAFDKSFGMVQIDAWLKYDAGDAVMSPDSVGIPRP
ncbi:MAG: tripartite tricarboxylate transporter substrate binding protein [Sphaerochaetaceae bacterium]